MSTLIDRASREDLLLALSKSNIALDEMSRAIQKLLTACAKKRVTMSETTQREIGMALNTSAMTVIEHHRIFMREKEANEAEGLGSEILPSRGGDG